MVKERTGSESTNSLSILILWCFFVSGFTGLVYEILWTRMTVQLIGGAPFAVCIVLTIFMGGLGLGSFASGRYIDRIKEPAVMVRIYGILELIIGAYALLIPVLLIVVKPLQVSLYNALYHSFVTYNLLTFIICALILSLPVICMGATLPLLCRFYVERLSDFGTKTGRLYGLNTIGAACGALVCGFWFIDRYGVNNTLYLVVAINALIGFICILGSNRLKSAVVPTNQKSAGTSNDRQDKAVSTINPNTHSPASDYNRSTGRWALVIFVVSGFCAMASEVLWTRLLGLLVGPTTYSFTIVLVTFISGLALGSVIFGRLADKSKNCFRLLLYSQLAAAILVLGVSQLLGNSQMFFAKLIFTFKDHFILLNVVKGLCLFLFMLLPTLCFGATFPLTGKIYTPSLGRVGRSIGFAYMLNSIGALSGSFCAGFLIIPLVGKELGLSLVVLLQLLTVLICAIFAFRQAVIRRRHLLISVAVVLIGVNLCSIYPAWNHNQLSTGKYHRFDSFRADITNVGWFKLLLQGSSILSETETGELVYYGEGIGGFTTVIKYLDAFGNDQFVMANSGKADASSRSDMITQTLSAHFPMLFHKGPKTVMVLGHASGVTAGEVLHYDVEQLDILEISEEVIKASDFFLPWNNDVITDPRTNVILQDGRAHLDLTKQKYDVIISEPSNPWMAGLAALFTKEFFCLVRDKLNPDGVFVQWIQAYQTNWEAFSLVGRTFADVFPNSVLLLTSPTGAGGDYLMVGFTGDQGLSLENAAAQLDCLQQSNNVILSDPRLLYRLIVSEDLKKLFGSGWINSDNRPKLEFTAPRLLYSSDTQISKAIAINKENSISPAVKNIVRDVKQNVDDQINFSAYALSVFSPFRGMVDLFRANSDQRLRFTDLLIDYCSQAEIDMSDINDVELRDLCLAAQAKALEQKLDQLSGSVTTRTYLGRLYSLMGESEKAAQQYSEALLIDSESLTAITNLGVSHASEGRLLEAVETYQRALSIDPEYAPAIANLGAARAEQGQTAEAMRLYRKALRIDPQYAKPHNNLGLILTSLGKLNQAIDHYNLALRIQPRFAEAHYNLGLALAKKNELDQAIHHYLQAIEINPTYSEAYNDLGIALTKSGQLDEAVEHFMRALQSRVEFAAAHNNLAIALVRQDKLAEAISHWQEAVRIKPDYTDARNNLNRALQMQNRQVSD